MQLRAYDRRVSNPSTKVPFTIRPYEPMIVEVTGADGKKYEVSVRLAIYEAVDLGQPDPSDPSLPTFNFRAQFVTDTKLVPS